MTDTPDPTWHSSEPARQGSDPCWQSPSTAWPLIQDHLARAVDSATYRIWLEPLSLLDIAGELVTLTAPPQTCGWIRERFGRLLQTATAAVVGPGTVVEVLSSDHPDADDSTVHPHSTASKERSSRWPPTHHAPIAPRSSTATHRSSMPASPQSRRSGGETAGPREATDPTHSLPVSSELLSNPKLTFNQFVIGDCNRLAHAAALTVAEMPAQAYNPLFICGPPGVGKTHLLHSIKALLLAHEPSLTVRCITGEQFTTDFLHALGGGDTGAFKASYRHVDVLLIDDVQFLERKAKTEEEFFHTFNSLHDSGSQIVLTCDRPPRNLQALEDRLRERFEAGLVADIKPPDRATRIAILRKRAVHDELDLVDQRVLELIADRITLNVRALEGALIRIVAFGSLTGRSLTAELAEEVLDGLYPTPAPLKPPEVNDPARLPPLLRDPHATPPGAGDAAGAPPFAPLSSTGQLATLSIADIQAATCKHFGLTGEQLISRGRSRRLALPRQLAMYLARELTSESLPSIGRHFGGRDHTTVLHACRRTSALLRSDSTTRKAVEDLCGLLRPAAR